MIAPRFDYCLFGLHVRSDVELPELAPVTSDGEPDVCVRSTRIALPKESPGLAVHDGALLLTIDQVARYLVTGGSEIIVEAVAGIDPRNIRLFLLGSAFGALLHQRGLFPLHANAIEIEGQAVAFTGPSGAGKSTLAAWFHDRGHRILADDVCVIRFDQAHAAFAYPGIPRLRLWKDVLERSGRGVGDLARSYVERDSDYDKFDVPIAAQRLDRPLELGAIYGLDRGPDFSIVRLDGAEAVSLLFDNTYRGGWVAEAETQHAHWSTTVQLARRVPVYRVFRPWGSDSIDAQAEQLRRHVLEDVRSPSG